MTPQEMKDRLVGLPETEVWEALKMFNRLKDAEILSALGSTDPFKDPTSLARAQGIRIGLFYLEQEIDRAYEEKKQEKDKTNA